ncbi:MAG: enoyl-ACP reductase, partial [Gammaproteobacteria bacterium]
MGFLTGKKALILGIANQKSIGYGIAQAMAAQGAELALTYQNDRLKKRIEACAKETGASLVVQCDVTVPAEIDTLFAELKEKWGSFDILVHSIGFAPAHELEGDFLENSTLEGFQIAHSISAYSLVELCKKAKPLLSKTGAVITLSYLGAERIFPNYNVMGLAKASLESASRYLAGSLGEQGVRVNTISAGPIRTLAASGIKKFRTMLQYAEQFSPLGRNVTTEEVGNAAAFLCSDLASGITGQTIYVDAGFNIAGLPLREVTEDNEKSAT